MPCPIDAASQIAVMSTAYAKLSEAVSAKVKEGKLSTLDPIFDKTAKLSSELTSLISIHTKGEADSCAIKDQAVIYTREIEKLSKDFKAAFGIDPTKLFIQYPTNWTWEIMKLVAVGAGGYFLVRYLTKRFDYPSRQLRRW